MKFCILSHRHKLTSTIYMKKVHATIVSRAIILAQCARSAHKVVSNAYSAQYYTLCPRKLCFKKIHVTTSSTITWTVSVRFY